MPSGTRPGDADLAFVQHRGCEHPAFRGILLPVVVISGVALALVVWWVSALVIDRWIRRRQRPSLLDRLQHYQRTSVAEEAQRWLEGPHGR